VDRRTIKRGSAEQVVDGKGFSLTDEIGYIQGKAADHDGRIVTIGQRIHFSTDTGEAWHSMPRSTGGRLTRDGDANTSFAIGLLRPRYQQHRCPHKRSQPRAYPAARRGHRPF